MFRKGGKKKFKKKTVKIKPYHRKSVSSHLSDIYYYPE